jgi:Domain of unknown function (DUF4440)
MKYCCLFLLAFAFCLNAFGTSSCPATVAHPDNSSALQFEHDWLKALQDKNTAALDCMLAPEFNDTSWKGQLRSKADVLRELPQRSDQYRQSLADVDAHVFGDTAVVRGVNVISDQQGHVVMHIRFTDVLRFAQGQWTAVAAQETAEPGH